MLLAWPIAFVEEDEAWRYLYFLTTFLLGSIRGRNRLIAPAVLTAHIPVRADALLASSSRCWRKHSPSLSLAHVISLVISVMTPLFTYCLTKTWCHTAIVSSTSNQPSHISLCTSRRIRFENKSEEINLSSATFGLVVKNFRKQRNQKCLT